MMVVLLGLPLLVGGCNSAGRDQELQQQKQLLELNKSCSERLIELAKAEDMLRSREKECQAAVEQIKRREEALGAREREAAQVAGKAAAAQARIEEARRALEVEKKQVDAERAEAQTAEANIEAAREFAMTRQPFLKELALAAAEQLAAYPPNLPGSSGSTPRHDEEYWYAECWRELSQANVALIPLDEEFKARAEEAVDQFIRRKSSNAAWKQRDKEPAIQRFFKQLGAAKNADGNLVLNKADFLKSKPSKRAGNEKWAAGYWRRIAGGADLVDLDTFKENLGRLPRPETPDGR
jgi:hypothetical protein